MEEEGSSPKLPNLHHLRATREGPITLKEAKLQIQETKRLPDMKAKREKAEKNIKRILTPELLKAQEEELVVIKAKQVKMMDEYNHYINFRDDPLPINVQLQAVELPHAEKKRKRRAKVIHEVFVKEKIMVDGMHRNLAPPMEFDDGFQVMEEPNENLARKVKQLRRGKISTPKFEGTLRKGPNLLGKQEQDTMDVTTELFETSHEHDKN
ncbi:hypothetical protein Tco_1158466 [Tanacetum coccineum]